MISPNKQKWCKKGQHYVDLANFYKHKEGKDGLRPDCKDCVLKRRREYYYENQERAQNYSNAYYANNAEKVKAYQRQNNVKKKDENREYSKEYRAKNREDLLKKKKEYYEANKKQHRERMAEYAKKHPELQKIVVARRRAKLKNAKGKFTKEQWLAKLAYFDNRCYLCKTSLNDKKMHLEHRIPISRGGTNWIANIAPACSDCNLKKSNKTEKEFKEVLANGSAQFNRRNDIHHLRRYHTC